jgi:hypothetical protein
MEEMYFKMLRENNYYWKQYNYGGCSKPIKIEKWSRYFNETEYENYWK